MFASKSRLRRSIVPLAYMILCHGGAPCWQEKHHKANPKLDRDEWRVGSRIRQIRIEVGAPEQDQGVYWRAETGLG